MRVVFVNSHPSATAGMELVGTRTSGLIQPCSYSDENVGVCSPAASTQLWETSDQTRQNFWQEEKFFGSV